MRVFHEKFREGLTLLELLVSIIIVVIVLAATYFTYINMLKGFKKESVSIETQMERLVGLEILRLDVEHAGYGIANNEPSPVIEWNSSTGNFTVRSTINTTNKETIGWALVDCTGTGAAPTRISGNSFSNSQPVVFLTLSKEFPANGDRLYGSCPGSGKYLVFPHDNATNGCSLQYCNSITYRKSATQNLDICNSNTRNLLRVVGNGSFPVLNCVADFQVRFDYDSDGDGKLSGSERNQAFSNFSCNSTNCTKLKRINIYLLLQEGRKDSSYTFNGDTTIDGITLSLPADYQHYRWKVVKISVKPMNF